MSFPDAVRTVLSKYATFSGRARRSEYWWFTLFTVIVYTITSIIDAVVGTGDVISLIVSLALLLPGLAVTVRRLHDTGRTGWWVLIALVPLAGAIVLLVFEVQDSEPGTNAYGPFPKADDVYEPVDYGWEPNEQ